MQVTEGDSRWIGVSTDAPSVDTAVSPAGGQSRRKMLPTITLRGVRFHAIDEQTCIRHILGEISVGTGGFVVTPNVDHLRRCRSDLSFSVLVSEASLVVADGMPVVWASRLQGTPLPQRVAGSDLISSLSAAAAKEGRSIFLLGGEPGTADAAARVLTSRSPNLKIAGMLCPPIGFEKNIIEMGKIIETLQAARPDIVYVALGSPKQEQLIDRLRRLLPQTWWLGVGVSFSFLCGDVKRAPLWMRKYGLEWIHRLLQEPGRLTHRYVVVGIPFASVLLLRSAAKGMAVRVLHRPAASDDETQDQPAPSAILASTKASAPAESENDFISNHDPEPFTDTREISVSGNHRLRALILLGGMIRQNTLGGALGRSAMDLPVGNDKTLLTRWLDEAAAVARTFGLNELPVRLLVDDDALEPRSAVGTLGAQHYRMERDTSEYRGTGGLLANLSVDYDDDDMILVGNAAQVLLDPLPALTLSLMKTRGVVSLIGHRDGEPSGLMLITCRTLRLIPRIGFVDMKEQALPIISKKYDVRVVQCRRPTGLAIRTLSDYIAALRALHRPTRAAATDPWAEDWKSTFAIVEAGATVSPTARIHDSVIFSGATVEANAVVVRSVVAGTVRRDRETVDQYVDEVAKHDRLNLARATV